MNGTKRHNLQLLERTIAILDHISKGEGPVSFTGIVKATRISKPSVHRILLTLENYRIVIRNGHAGYQLGPRILGWSQSCMESQGILFISKPWLGKIWDEIGETIHLVHYENGNAYYLFKIESRHPLQMRSRIGDTILLHSTAAGKAILFALPKPELKRILSSSSLEAKTKNTITDPVILEKQLEIFRNRGFSDEIEENERDICCVAAPILNNYGYPVGAVSITCPIYRSDEQKVQGFGSFLADIVPQISFELGYNK